MHSLCTNRLDIEGLSAKLTFESRNKDLAWNGMGWRWVLEERERDHGRRAEPAEPVNEKG